MKLLIAGWHGQVARALVEAAARHPAITTLAIGRPALDLCKPASVANALADGKPDVIINCAAYTAVDQAETEPAAAHELNCEGARLIAEEAARRNAAIIHLSTDYVFDGTSSRPYAPGDSTNPVSVYGRTKRDGEDAVRRVNSRHVIVRTSWVHSPTGKNFVKTMLRVAAQRDSVSVVADQHGCPTYAPHLAGVLVAIAERAARAPADDKTIWGTYHAVGSGATTWAGLAEAVFHVSARNGGPSATVTPITTTEYPTPAKRPMNSVLDCTSTSDVFAAKMPDWRDGVDACVKAILRDGAVS